MTPNEINFNAGLIELLENKNEKIRQLSIVELEKKIEEVRASWLKRYNTLQDNLNQQEKKYNHLVERLKKDGYISADIRSELGMEDNNIKL